MTKYYTKQFTPSLVENISEWLNSFEEQRNGRPRCEYFVEIVSYDVFDNTILITIKVEEYTNARSS